MARPEDKIGENAVSSLDAWAQYRRWNGALAEEFFSDKSRGRLVYIDLDEPVLRRIGGSAFPRAKDHKRSLIDAVVATLDIGRLRGTTFAPHRRALREWRHGDHQEPPPCVALLALFVIVAEGMAAGEGFASSNYYGRLAATLGITNPEGKNTLGRDFRNDTLPFWDALNSWLDDADGRRGLPTAFAFDRRRFVGIPISQALVREVDRTRLQQCFVSYGLRPRQRIASSDMERVLSEWLPESNVSTALKSLWKKPDARSRIAEVACLELEVWDGEVADVKRDDDGQANLLLAAHVQTQPRKTFEFALLAKESPALTGGKCSVKGGSQVVQAALNGGQARLVEALSGNYLRLVSDRSINFQHALVANLELQAQGPTGKLIGRRWKPLVILRYDPETHLFIEAKRVELADRHLILAHETISDSVSAHLEKIATDYQQLSSRDNGTIPRNWFVFPDVRIAGLLPVPTDDLQALVPVATTNIVFEGGFGLPVRNTWHARHPPQIHVATLSDTDCSAQLINTQNLTEEEEEEGEPIDLGVFREKLTCDLANPTLKPGDYRVVIQELRGAKSSRPIASAAFRLRASEHYRPRAEIRFGHNPTNQPCLWPLTSNEINDADSIPVLRGTQIRNWPEPATEDLADAAVAEELAGGSGEAETPPDAVVQDSGQQIATPTCIERGHHVWALPPGEAHPPRYQELLGQCKDCGLERWFGGRVKVRVVRSQRSAHVEVTPRVIHLDFTGARCKVSSDSFFDALCYLGSGSRRDVASMVEEFSDQPWVADELLRNLSSLGHLEIRLDERYARISNWQVVDPTINYLDRELIYLSGYRSPRLIRRILEDARALGGKVNLLNQSAAPSRILLAGLDETEVKEIANSVSDALGRPIQVSFRPSAALACRLPPLKRIGGALPVVPFPSVPCQQFGLQSLRWTDVQRPEQPGAYRFFTWGWVYGFVDDQLISSGEYHSGDHRMVKHLAAIDAGVPLVAYNRRTMTLAVPLGAELPWMYERAVMLESGLAPDKLSSGVVEYKNVSYEVAACIWVRLKGGNRQESELKL